MLCAAPCVARTCSYHVTFKCETAVALSMQQLFSSSECPRQVLHLVSFYPTLLLPRLSAGGKPCVVGFKQTINMSFSYVRKHVRSSNVAFPDCPSFVCSPIAAEVHGAHRTHGAKPGVVSLYHLTYGIPTGLATSVRLSRLFSLPPATNTSMSPFLAQPNCGRRPRSAPHRRGPSRRGISESFGIYDTYKTGYFYTPFPALQPASSPDFEDGPVSRACTLWPKSTRRTSHTSPYHARKVAIVRHTCWL
jgi:hypothetical protein